MRRHLETELKWSLSPAAYRRLRLRLGELLGKPKILRQVNRFFDCRDGRLLRHGLNVRLRRENGRLLLTCKRRAALKPPLFRHDEWEEWLDPALWRRLDRPGTDLNGLVKLPAPVRELVGKSALLSIGGFANHRLEYAARPDLLCLDRTDFSEARRDHELEVETPAPKTATARWGAHLLTWGVEFSPQPQTKFARFLAQAKAVKPTGR
jgi:uncharacterized protein YjbK